MTTEAESLCWNCRNEVGFKHFCSQCVKIQPLRPDEDFFIFFGIPRRLSLDPELLRKTYYDLSRKFHPDFYQRATPEEREIATGKSALLNEAYETLRGPFKRAEYLLDLEGIDVKRDLGPVSADLLAEVFEIQENVDTFLQRRGKDSAGESVLRQTLEGELESLRKRQDRLTADLEKLFLDWDRCEASVDQTVSKKALAERLLRLLHEKKYIDSTLRNVQANLAKS